MTLDENAKKDRDLGTGDDSANPSKGKDRGTYFATPLSKGGFTDEHGAIISDFSPTLSEGPDGVYKSQMGLDKHVLSEKHRADLARSEKNHQPRLAEKHLSEKHSPDVNAALSPQPKDPPSKKRKIPNPTIVAGISLFILTIVAALLVTVLLNNVQSSSEKKNEDRGPLSIMMNITP